MEQIKVYKGQNKELLFESIKAELGDSAIVLSVDKLPDSSYEVKVSAESVELIPSNEPVNRNGDTLLRSLLQQGFYYPLATQIAANLGDSLSQVVERGWTIPSFVAGLQGLITLNDQVSITERYLLLTGAQGVGKTSTAIKLAVQLSEFCDLNTAVISIGSSPVKAPIGAFDLDVFAVDLDQIAKKGLAPIVQQCQESDLVLIDAPMTGELDSTSSKILTSALASLGDEQSSGSLESLLVLDSRASYHYADQLIRSVGDVEFQGVVLTRVDDQLPLGAVLSAVSSHQLPIWFLSTGADIPTDIEPASLPRLAWFALRSLAGAL
jgi:flagellar biosynthesis GTPase FlhF